LISTNSSYKKDSREYNEREEAKKRILDEYPDMLKDELEFVLSLPVERKVPKVTQLETIHATAEQQQEMERLLLKKNNNE
jgi:hypothetical protein